ncbi:MAG: biotin/lipoyl-containing protein [Thermoplasmata archaeon]
MRITIERDAKTASVEVTGPPDAVTVGAERYPVTVVRATATSVELEIAGERVVVENWPEHFPEPPGPVDVNGERWTVGVERGSVTATAGEALKAPPPAPAYSLPAAKPPSRAGTPLVPPMPGRVIEVRVKEGDRVHKGDLLLVLEAMKMRNELTSPADGVVRGLAVSAGANARAKEPMLFIVPE